MAKTVYPEVLRMTNNQADTLERLKNLAFHVQPGGLSSGCFAMLLLGAFT